MAVTKQAWAESCRQFREMVNADDDALRAFTLGAIRATARDASSGDGLNEIREILDGLDEFLGYS